MSEEQTHHVMRLWRQFREQNGLRVGAAEMSSDEELALIRQCRAAIAPIVGPPQCGLSGTLATIISHWTTSWTHELTTSQIWKEAASMLDSARKALNAADLSAAEFELQRLIRLGCRSSREFFPVAGPRARTSDQKQRLDSAQEERSTADGLNDLVDWFSRLRT